MFPVVNKIPAFVSIKIEAVWKVIIALGECFKCLNTSPHYSKSTIKVKVCSKLTIKTPQWHQWAVYW